MLIILIILINLLLLICWIELAVVACGFAKCTVKYCGKTEIFTSINCKFLNFNKLLMRYKLSTVILSGIEYPVYADNITDTCSEFVNFLTVVKIHLISLIQWFVEMLTSNARCR